MEPFGVVSKNFVILELTHINLKRYLIFSGLEMNNNSNNTTFAVIAICISAGIID